MGDPKRAKKKFGGPGHPWQRLRIEEEKVLKKDYAYKNKKEINKMRSIVRGYRSQARKLISARTEQAKMERKQLLESLNNLGLLEKDAELDDVLALTIRDIMERRLQTVVFRKKISNTVKQARQLITHKHICIGGRIVTSPSHIVSRDEEFHLKINPNSPLLGKIKGGKVGG